MRPNPRLFVVTVGILALLIVAAVTGSAQVPDKFTNLKVLPKDITKQELMGEMKAMATGLGVRCEYCHAGDPAKGFRGLDFPSDEKETKKSARSMLEMVKAINSRYLTSLDSTVSTGMQVSCMTCHHRQERPRSLEAEMIEAVDTGGAGAAIALYKDRREEYYGSAAYDFGERTVIETASKLSENGNPQAAVAIMQLNVEYYPELTWNYEVLAQLYAEMDAIDAAKAALQKGLELDPDNRRLQHMLQQLEEEKE